MIGASTAGAVDNGGTFKDGLFYGIPRGGDVRNPKEAYGWQMGYEPNPYLTAEITIGRQKDRIDDLNILPTGFAGDLELEIVHASAGFKIGYPIHRFYPYAGAGIGYYYMRGHAGKINQTIAQNPALRPSGVTELRVGADIDNVFGYHLALGLEVLITKRWEVFAEYRWVKIDSDITINRTETRRQSGLYQVRRDTTSEKQDFGYDHGLVRLGVNYRF
jgi:opacity protein-like surface antigen